MANRPNQQQSEPRRRDVERLAAEIYARTAATPGSRAVTADARTDQALAEAQAFYDRLDARQTEEK